MSKDFMEKKMIDLISDTITTPTDEMRSAMTATEVGDDLLREDPTTNILQEKTASITGNIHINVAHL